MSHQPKETEKNVDMGYNCSWNSTNGTASFFRC